VVNAATQDNAFEIVLSDNFGYIEQMVLQSSRYTQPDNVTPAALQDYRNNYTLSFTPDELSFLGYEEILNDAKLRVYFEQKSFSVVIENKETGYFWSSRAEFQHIEGTNETPLFRNMMNSGLWIESVRMLTNGGAPININEKSLTTESLYRIAGVAYPNDESLIDLYPECPTGYASSNVCSQVIIPERYNQSRVRVDRVSTSTSAIVTKINIFEYGFSFNVELRLEDGVFKSRVFSDTIQESDPKFKLTGIYLFPYLGSTRKDKTPGYFMIPDGVGALVRINQMHGDSFQSRFYGSEFGYDSYTSSQLTMPIYGIVHEVGGNGYYANITEGSEQGILYADLYGANTRYNYMRTKYSVRELYRRIINASGGGSLTLLDQFTQTDYAVDYHFLGGSDASYVGIAKNYRDKLRDAGVLKDMVEPSTSIPIHLNYLMADTENAFIGVRRIRMTRIKDVLDIYETLKAAGVTNQMVTLHGWSDDGNGVGLARTRLNESKRSFEKLSDTLAEDGNSVYLYNDYVVASDSKRVNYINDIARNVSRLKMTYSNRSFSGVESNIQLLYPEATAKKLKADASFYEKLGYGAEVGSIGNMLFSYYDNKVFERGDAMNYYQEALSNYDNLLLSSPNSYLWQYMSGYTDMAVTNGQFNFYTDLVPVLPIVLSGSVPMFTPFLNFNALGSERLLMMIDFGINPRYILTEENTYKMRYTRSSNLYTTAISDYETEIIDTYHYINDALKYVVGAMVVEREVLGLGIIKVTYDNNVSIYINYSDQIFMNSDVILFGKSYEVVL
jgi:hypothetical protein